MIQAELEVKHHGCLMTSLGPGAYAMQVSSDASADIVLMKGPVEEVQRFLRHIESEAITPHDIMHKTEGGVLIRTKNPPVGVIPTILDEGCTILWPAVYRDGVERYRILAPSRRRVARLAKDLQEFGPTRIVSAFDVDVDALTMMVPVGELAFDLSPRQLEGLLTAVKAGYYEIPRRAHVEEISHQLGVSRSTAEEHLRKAECSVVAAFARLIMNSSPVVNMARKGRGRPRKRPGP